MTRFKPLSGNNMYLVCLYQTGCHHLSDYLFVVSIYIYVFRYTNDYIFWRISLRRLICHHEGNLVLIGILFIERILDAMPPIIEELCGITFVLFEIGPFFPFQLFGVISR